MLELPYNYIYVGKRHSHYLTLSTTYLKSKSTATALLVLVSVNVRTPLPLRLEWIRNRRFAKYKKFCKVGVPAARGMNAHSNHARMLVDRLYLHACLFIMIPVDWELSTFCAIKENKNCDGYVNPFRVKVMSLELWSVLVYKLFPSSEEEPKVSLAVPLWLRK